MLNRLTIAFVLVVLGLTRASASAAAAPRPRLGVLVVFDQLRSIDVDRLEPLFGPGGFGGLGALGAARFDVRYPCAATETGPGHATLATGASPAVHGVTVNTWFDGATPRYVVDDPTAPVLMATDGRGRSAIALRAGTLGDAMRSELGAKARVVTISVKDRAAILTGGRAADLAIWYEPSLGRFTTSKAYRQELPAWLADLGQALPAAAMATGTWSPLPLPKRPAGLADLLPADDLPGESGAYIGLGPTFPHDLRAVAADLRAKAYRAVPQSLDDLVTLALRAVDEEHLGQDLIPDLLVVSFSATDMIGHLYGPTSLEHAEILRRADLALRALVKGLSHRLGRDGFALAVSSDHGSTPVPEQLAHAGLPGGRTTYAAVTTAASDALAKALGDAAAQKRVLGFSPPHLYLALDDLAPAQAADARRAVKRAVAAVAGVGGVLDLDDRADDADPYRPLYATCRVAGRSGTLLVRQEARIVFTEDAPTGTDHGSPYLYDRRVPLWLVGAGVRPGRYSPDGDARDVAPTLAFMLGVSPPDAAEGTILPAVGERGAR
ncbi:MAG: alkaline phosphatase family protein [Myxococcota bacterium]